MGEVSSRKVQQSVEFLISLRPTDGVAGTVEPDESLTGHVLAALQRLVLSGGVRPGPVAVGSRTGARAGAGAGAALRLRGSVVLTVVPVHNIVAVVRLSGAPGNVS